MYRCGICGSINQEHDCLKELNQQWQILKANEFANTPHTNEETLTMWKKQQNLIRAYHKLIADRAKLKKQAEDALTMVRHSLDLKYPLFRNLSHDLAER